MSDLVSLARHPTRQLWIDRLERLHRQRSVILGYHGISRSRRRHDLNLLLTHPSRFQTQLESLLEAGFEFVTAAELARLGDGGEPPPGYAAITFDDGMRNNRTVAFPILQRYGIPATVYISIDLIGGVSPWVDPDGDNRMLDTGEIRELAGAGWELGAHTMSHPDLSTLAYEACRREIEESKIALEEIGQVSVETFAYPFGRYDEQTIAAVRDSGLSAAVTTGSGIWEPYELTRAMVGALDPTPVFMLKLTDRYEPLLRSPPLRLLRRASKTTRIAIQARRQA
ncbi:MAG TPA: polysaccharide deacetylase family protein [Solirubrobacteraceae bacterium]|jgi:peptidoglycan/xylan/chitin deacetylase (PgdA/CDA1 family)|nr:polysaccharide deacetylase family protein [Solirubrobacteraceae bacterium]